MKTFHRRRENTLRGWVEVTRMPLTVTFVLLYPSKKKIRIRRANLSDKLPISLFREGEKKEDRRLARVSDLFFTHLGRAV